MKTQKDNFNKIAAIIVAAVVTPLIILIVKDLIINGSKML